MQTVYLVQIQYDPTVDYGCGVDMTTRDTLHIADSEQAAQEWIQAHRSNISQQYQEVSPWDLIIVSWTVNASWDEDERRFVFEHDLRQADQRLLCWGSVATRL